jgi:hypothetical protein
MQEQIFKELESAGELGTCQCKRQFWFYWYTGIKDGGRTVYPLMKKCAICFFRDAGRKNKGINKKT